MKPEHIAVLEIYLPLVRMVCSHNVKGSKQGTMCACAFLNSAIEQLKKGYIWQ